MNIRFFFIFSLAFAFASFLSAQRDSSLLKRNSYRAPTHADSLYLNRLNTSGNLMIAGGIGLCGAGSYLIYQGMSIYNTMPAHGSTDPAGDTDRNHKQGTAYIAAGTVAIVGGIVLTAFGIRNKHDFKIQKRMMSLQSGMLDNGHPGLVLNF